MDDWAAAKANEIVDPYRHLFRTDAAAHADGLVHVLAGELRAVESKMQRQAVAAGETLMSALQALASH